MSLKGLKNTTLDEIAELIKSHKSITLVPHIGPDGDCLGCLTALNLALKKIGKHVEIALNEEISPTFLFMQKFADLSVKDSLPKSEIYLILDNATPKRIIFIDQVIEEKQKGVKVALIDHHASGEPQEISDLYYIEPNSSSNAEIIYELICKLGIEIDKDIATCLLTGIESDTSSFQNQNTNSETFRISSILMSKGARLSTIIRNTFLEAPIDILKIRGLILERLVFNTKFKTACSYLTYEDFKKYKLTKEATSGLANMLNTIEGINILFFLTEEEKGFVKVSTRSRKENIDLSKLAGFMGGGGHRGASGFATHGTINTKELRVEK